MNKDLMIEKTKLFVKDKLEYEGSGHDWFHIERVYNLAKYIAQKEMQTLLLLKCHHYYMILMTGNFQIPMIQKPQLQKTF